jgi:hypothetical protein
MIGGLVLQHTVPKQRSFGVVRLVVGVFFGLLSLPTSMPLLKSPKMNVPVLSPFVPQLTDILGESLTRAALSIWRETTHVVLADTPPVVPKLLFLNARNVFGTLLSLWSARTRLALKARCGGLHGE